MLLHRKKSTSFPAKRFSHRVELDPIAEGICFVLMVCTTASQAATCRRHLPSSWIAFLPMVHCKGLLCAGKVNCFWARFDKTEKQPAISSSVQFIHRDRKSGQRRVPVTFETVDLADRLCHLMSFVTVSTLSTVWTYL